MKIKVSFKDRDTEFQFNSIDAYVEALYSNSLGDNYIVEAYNYKNEVFLRQEVNRLK